MSISAGKSVRLNGETCDNDLAWGWTGCWSPKIALEKKLTCYSYKMIEVYQQILLYIFDKNEI